ncbi:MAG: DNA helicase RecQ [Hyphomicrobiaceae bacterium]
MGVQAALKLETSELPPLRRAQCVLERVFGYPSFRSHQASIIEALIAGRDVLALMPTGGGKSLCYQIPSLVRSGTGVVVSPLIALMQDQVDALSELGVRAAYLNSTQEVSEQRQVEARLLNGDLDLLYAAPERLMTERMLSLLRGADIALFALDEAHCVSQWGHDFRPEYRQLSVLPEHFPHVPRIALTATADLRTRQEIVAQLHLGEAETFIASFDRPNIRYQITDADGDARERFWRFLRDEHPADSGIVYCLSRKSVEETAAWLAGKGRKALAYHAGFDAETRRLNQRRFLEEDGLVMVATIAFGMGIDKPDVRFVAHLNLPKSIEAYYQETGRAGRDGEPADAWLAYRLKDVVTYRQWITESEAGEAQKRIEQAKLDALVGLTEIVTCRRQALLAYFGERLDLPCGNCDNCLNPPVSRDMTEAARKALSTIYRTGEGFGAGYVVDVLVGKTDDRIRRNGHDRVTTFGIGQDVPEAEWRRLIRQLVARGLVDVDLERHGILRLNPACRSLLRGEASFMMREASRQEAPKRKAKRGTVERLPSEGGPLFDALRGRRAELAKVAGVPPYVICHDRTLVDLMRLRPRTLSDLQMVIGFGAKKIERYGAAFLEVLRTAPET